MIVNTGGRTDTVQYFGQWLLTRFRQGYVLVRNPLFPHNVTRYELDPAKVDCVLFCSKNYAPLLPCLGDITGRFGSYCHYTITAYGSDVEPGVPSIDQSIDTLLALEKLVGKERITWRYDPVLLTKKYTVQKHLITFEHIATRLSGHIDRCIFSFVEVYKKLELNMPELLPLTEQDMDCLARGLGAIARRHGIRLQLCGSFADYSAYGIMPSGCTTLDILGTANGMAFKGRKHSGMRRGCRCIASHDIGAYDTCPNGCRYCYANKSPELARKNFLLHDPDSPLLLGTLGPDDTVTHAAQHSFRDATGEQLSLF